MAKWGFQESTVSGRVAVVATADEVAWLVRAAVRDRDQVIDLGCGLPAGAAVSVAFENALPQFPPGAGAAAAPCRRPVPVVAVGIGCESSADASVPADDFEPCGLVFEPVERHLGPAGRRASNRVRPHKEHWAGWLTRLTR